MSINVLMMFQGLEEAVIRNIGACKQLAETVQTAYGPIGMNKMVINHLGKLFVTNDAATIIRELEVYTFSSYSLTFF
ncbi:T-complex protein 1 subunit theta [Daphnia magna]|uniref:T-complex protein 1 subunit theta n=1 Tax=Daphnia magna TaxID=35525 RepID=A0A162BTC2_9CRUS|nr:T-complex protein 1 subunit theta [Daphnia magna]